MLEDLFYRFEGAFAPNTLRAYKADFKHLLCWCDEQRLDVTKLNGKDFANYLTRYADTLSTSTIRRRLASISTILDLSGWNNPTNTPDAILTMKRIQRLKGNWQKQASPLTQSVLTELLEVCDDSVAGQRNKVLLHLGYETMRRRSELCSFRFDDLVLHPSGKVAIKLNYSKTDQFGAGKLLPISKGLHELINDWKQIAIDGHILRGIKPNDALTQKLSPGSINIILRNLQSNAGLNIEPPLSGHSFRVGRALDLLESGESLPKIMLRGGWKTESTVIQYLRAWNLD